MFKKESEKKFGMSSTMNRKLADKRSVFDSDFIGRDNKINPRTVKELGAVLCLCALLAFVFYANFYNKTKSAAKKQDPGTVSAQTLAEITFESSWKKPDASATASVINPMLSSNKLLQYERKYLTQDEPEQQPQQQEQPKAEEVKPVSLKKIKIEVKGILWNPNGQSTALIGREMLKENQNYKGYTVSKVLRRAVILSDTNGNNITLNVGENTEIIATDF